MSQISPINELIPLTSSDAWYMPRVALMNIKSDVPSGVYVVVFSIPYSTDAPDIHISEESNVSENETDNPKCLMIYYNEDLPELAPAEQMICIVTYQWNAPETVEVKDKKDGFDYQLFPPVYLKVKDKKHKGVVKTHVGVSLPELPNAPLYECNTFIIAPIMANGASQLFFLGALSNILSSDDYSGYTINNDNCNISAPVNPGNSGSTKVICCNLINGAYQTPLLNAPYSITVTHPNVTPPTATFDWNSKIVL